MSWIFGGTPGGGGGGKPPNPPDKTSPVEDAKDENERLGKRAEFAFDSEALERAAKAAKQIEKSSTFFYQLTHRPL